MSAAAWEPGPVGPPAARRTGDGRAVKLRDGRSPLARVHPAPLLNAEVELWSAPPAGPRFSLHPVGVVALYQRAHVRLDEAGVLAAVGVDERERLEGECWRISAEVFTPGEGVRAALERVVQDRVIRPNLAGHAEDGEKLKLLQLAYVAGWAVFNAACDLAREAS